MPHFIVEYTDNLRDAGDIKGLLRKVNQVLIAQGGVFPTGAIRSRAIELHDYVVADATSDDAFVHATLKIGAGRTPEQKKKACDELFATMKEHFAALYAQHGRSPCRWSCTSSTRREGTSTTTSTRAMQKKVRVRTSYLYSTRKPC